MHDPRSIAEALHRAADSVARLDAVSDWVDAEHELLTVAEASAVANVSSETIRRWAADHRLGRLFADSLWLVSYRRLLAYIEKRSGRAALLDAQRRADEMFKSSLSVQQLSTRMLVATNR